MTQIINKQTGVEDIKEGLKKHAPSKSIMEQQQDAIAKAAWMKKQETVEKHRVKSLSMELEAIKNEHKQTLEQLKKIKQESEDKIKELEYELESTKLDKEYFEEQVKILESDLAVALDKLEGITTQSVDSKDNEQIKRLNQEIKDLKEQLDSVRASESIIEKLTEKNLSLEEVSEIFCLTCKLEN